MLRGALKEAKLALAIGERLGKPMLIRYMDRKGQETQRTVVPFSIIDHHGSQGIWAFCLKRQSMRWFYFRNIIGCDPVEVEVTIPSDLEILQTAVTASQPTRFAIAAGIEWLQQLRPWFKEKKSV